MDKIKINSYKDYNSLAKINGSGLKIYKLTENFPKSELYGLTSQIKRCAVSIPSNIAEGKLRKSKKEFIQFLRISYGSGAELETQIEISKRLQFTDIKNYEKVDVLLLEIMKILNTLLKNLKDPK